MTIRIGTRLTWLLCGLLLALPVAHAKKSQDGDGESSKNKSSQSQSPSAPLRGGYLEKDNGRGNGKIDRRSDERGYSQSAPQQDDDRHRDERRSSSPQRYEDKDYLRRSDERRGSTSAPYPQAYDKAYERRGGESGYAPAPRYSDPQPRYAPRGMNLSEAVSAAERSTGGRVLSAEPIDDNGRPAYRVKVLTGNGRVQVLYLDAE